MQLDYLCNLVLWFMVMISADMVISASRRRQIVSPTFMNSGRRNITAHRGDRVELRCKIKNLGPKQVAWRKVPMDYPLTVGTFVFEQEESLSINARQLSKRVSEWNLVIHDVEPRHSGIYECQISSTELLTHYVNLRVIDSPVQKKSEIVITGTHFVNIYDPIKLRCNATRLGRAPDHIDWFFQGLMVRTSDSYWRDRVEITRHKPEVPGNSVISDFIIDHSKLSDQGRYICRSSSQEGEIYNNTSIDVNVLNTNKEVSKRRKEGPEVETRDQLKQNPRNTAADLKLNLILCVSILVHWYILNFVFRRP